MSKEPKSSSPVLKPVTAKHFSKAELACHCGCGAMPQQSIADKLDEIREAYGKPITATNVKRCQRHNDTMIPKGAPGSAHVEGIAADLVHTEELFAFISSNLERFGLWMEDPGKTRDWIHVDLRQRSLTNRIFKV